MPSNMTETSPSDTEQRDTAAEPGCGDLCKMTSPGEAYGAGRIVL